MVMELKPGMSAIVTGGASGIGRAISLALARKGLFVTVLDFSEERGKDVVSLIEKENGKFHQNSSIPSSMYIKCDVTNARDLAAAFEKHTSTYQSLDICVNNAGIGTQVLFHHDKTDGSSTWRRTIDVDLVAVIECTRLAILSMRTAKRPGVVINIGSAAGLYPAYPDPVYSGAKGGVVLFSRSLAPLKREGIRVNVLCPEFVETDMGSTADKRILNAAGGFIPMEMVVNGALELITDETKAGACLWITKRRGLEYWPTPVEEKKYRIPSLRSKKSSNYIPPSNIDVPNAFEKVVVHTLSHDFRSATKIVRTQLSLPIKPEHALVKIIYAGVNASDVNYSSGRYFSGDTKEIAARLPFDAGFEAVGLVAAVGEHVQLRLGTPVALLAFGSYAEFTEVPAKYLLPVPRPDAEVVSMLSSGLTASISLEKAGKLTSGEVVLVTAAAGGTGQFAVQLAKLAGNKVVATCGGESKAKLLRSLGADRVIDYRKENIKDVLIKEFPKGVDIIYESVGGEMFNVCLNALAVYGRLIVIGMVSQAAPAVPDEKQQGVWSAAGTAMYGCQKIFGFENSMWTVSGIPFSLLGLYPRTGGALTVSCFEWWWLLGAWKGGGEVRKVQGYGETMARQCQLAILGGSKQGIAVTDRKQHESAVPRGWNEGRQQWGDFPGIAACLEEKVRYHRKTEISSSFGRNSEGVTGIDEAGFFLNNYSHLWHEHVNRLFDLYSSGKLKVAVDPKKFLGLASVADAVEHLHSGQSLGKVVVCIDPAFGQQNAKL
ncbi:uncharacterized protein LOC110019897 [Phalaenopsis equestris]|uniref:uncharacterized protein LOC110019897 n=1 Tax=Phalaenopsis equestris TaxID=78828 RepID=UPI0009E2D2FF|nr:uncharacterized protein LOC110019897 [Phalaenopsis equestris]